MSSPLLTVALPEVIAQADELPSLPVVAMDVLRLCRGEETTLDDLAECLSRDPSLAVKLLKLSNSSLYRMGDEVTTLQRATLVLGMKSVQLMALSFSLATSLPRTGDDDFDYEAFWHRALARAVAARAMASLVGAVTEDEAFLCGLLTELGQLVMARTLGEDYDDVLRQTRHTWPTMDLEQQRLGFHHADIGIALLGSWDLPQIITIGVGFGQRPDELEADTNPMLVEFARILRLACSTVEVLTAKEKGQALVRFETEAAEFFELAPAAAYDFITGLEPGIRELSRLFNVDLPERGTEEILDQARQQRNRIEDREGRHRLELIFDHRRTIALDPELFDPLTGIPGSAAFERFLELEVKVRLQKDVRSPLGLVLATLDDTRRWTPAPDGSGTQGTNVTSREPAWLAEFGRAMMRLLRGGDLLAHLGQGRYGIVMCDGPPFAIRALCQRLGRGVARVPADLGHESEPVSFSFGGASLGAARRASDRHALQEVARRYLARSVEGPEKLHVHPTVLVPR